MTKKEFFKTVFSKTNAPLLFAFIFLSLFTLGIFALNSYWGYQKDIERSTLDNRILAIALEQYIDTQFKNADLALQEVPSFLSFVDFSSKSSLLRLSSLLDNVRRPFQGIETIGVTNSEGIIVANTDWSEANIMNIQDRQYFIEHKMNPNTDLVISDPIISRATGNQIVILCRKLPHLPGRFNGIILVSINLKKLMETFATIGTVGPRGSLTLINKKRILLARFPYRGDQLGKYVRVNPKIEQSLQADLKEGTFEGNSVVDGVPRIFTFIKLKNFPLTIIVGKNKGEILGNWQNYTITTGLIGLLFSLFIFFAFYKYFTNIYESEKQKILLLNSSKMSSIGVMAAGIAHEINNPLTIVSGKAMQILSMLERDNAEKVDLLKIKNNAQKINELTFKIAKIVQGLKLISQDSKNERLEKNAISIIINTALDLSRERIKNEGIEITVNILNDAFINCKLTQLSQVFLNLINNSFDAIKDLPEKWISIEAHLVNDRQIQVSVTDSGRGISGEIVDKLAAPFFTTKSSDKNIGLGLSVSKTIIESYGGELYIDKTSINSKFIIKLGVE